MHYFTFILKIFVILLGYTNISCIFVKEITTKKIEIMAVRNQNSRQSRNDVTFSINGIYITLIPKDWTTPKSYLYSIKKRILENKIEIPSILEKTGMHPFLIGECSKELKNNVNFYWN